MSRLALCREMLSVTKTTAGATATATATTRLEEMLEPSYQLAHVDADMSNPSRAVGPKDQEPPRPLQSSRSSYPPAAPLVWINGWPGVGKRSIAENLSGLLGLERTIVILNCNYNAASSLNIHPETCLGELSSTKPSSGCITITHTLPLAYTGGPATTPPLTGGGANRAALDLRLKRLKRPYVDDRDHLRVVGRHIMRRRYRSGKTMPLTSTRKLSTMSIASEHSSTNRYAHSETGGMGIRSPESRPEAPYPPDSPSPAAAPALSHHSPGVGVTPPLPALFRSTPSSRQPSTQASSPQSRRPRNPKSLHLDLSLGCRLRGSYDVCMLSSAAPAVASNRDYPAVMSSHPNDDEIGVGGGAITGTDYFTPFPYSAQLSGVTSYPVEPTSAGSVRGEGPTRKRSGTLLINRALSEAGAKMSDSVRLKRRPFSVIGQPSSVQDGIDWKGYQDISSKNQKRVFPSSSLDTSSPESPISPGSGPDSSWSTMLRSNSFASTCSGFTIGKPMIPLSTQMTSARRRTYSVAGAFFAPLSTLQAPREDLSRIESLRTKYSTGKQSSKSRSEPRRSPPLSAGIISQNNSTSSPHYCWTRGQAIPNGVRSNRLSQPITPCPPSSQGRQYQPVDSLEHGKLSPSEAQRHLESQAPARSASPPLRDPTPIPVSATNPSPPRPSSLATPPAFLKLQTCPTSPTSYSTSASPRKPQSPLFQSVSLNGSADGEDGETEGTERKPSWEGIDLLSPTGPAGGRRGSEKSQGPTSPLRRSIEEAEDIFKGNGEVKTDSSTPTSIEVTPTSSPLSNIPLAHTPKTSPPSPPLRVLPPIPLCSPGATPPSQLALPPLLPFSPSSSFPPFSPPSFAPPPPPPTRPRALSDDTSHRAVHRQRTFMSYVSPRSFRTTTIIVTDCQTADLSGAGAANSFRQAAQDSGRPFVAVTLECSEDETAKRIKNIERACCDGTSAAFGTSGPKSKLRDVGVAMSVRRGRGLFRFGERGRVRSSSVREKFGGSGGASGTGTVSAPTRPIRSHCGAATRRKCGEGEIFVDEERLVNLLSLDVTELEANEAASRIWQFLGDIDARCRMLKEN